jgi:hypothetical protein
MPTKGGENKGDRKYISHLKIHKCVVIPYSNEQIIPFQNQIINPTVQLTALHKQIGSNKNNCKHHRCANTIEISISL